MAWLKHAPSVRYGHVPYDYEHCFLALEEQTTQGGVQNYKKNKNKNLKLGQSLVNDHMEKQSFKSFQLSNQRQNHVMSSLNI